MQKTNGQAVVILMSDHGYRGWYRMVKKFRLIIVLTHCICLIRTIAFFMDSISNVNQFRMLFNTLFKTQ
jgi:hypothetical protein